MSNWDDATIVSVETTQVVDTNPKVWINSALESINEQDFYGALEKISSAKEYANGDRNTLGMAYALEIVCYYETNDKGKAREIKNHLDEGLEEFLFEYPEYIIRYRGFDSKSWDGLWEKLIVNWVNAREYQKIQKFSNDIDSQLFARLVDNGFVVDVVKESQFDCFSKLAEGGYDFSKCVKNDNNLAMIATSIQTSGCYDILNYFLENRIFPINWQNESGETLLMCAIRNEATKNAKLILEYKPDVNLSETHGLKQTALHIASTKGLADIVEMLISLGADVNKKDSCNYTALHYAAKQKETKTLETLIKFNSNIHEKNCKGQTALHLAIGNDACVKALIKNGADVNATDDAGKDPMVYAVMQQEPSSVSLLHKAGANLNKRYKSLGHNRTILHYIAANKHWSGAAKSTWREILDCDVDVNLTDDDGYTPLMLSVDHRWTFSDELGLARALVQKGASTSVRAKNGKTVETIMRSHHIDPSKLYNTKASNWFTKLFD